MSEFDDYSDLFAEDGDFDIPSSIKAGLSFVANDQLRINVDVEHTAFSEVASVGNPMANLFRCSAFAPFAPPNSTGPEFCLGGSEGAGFGWDDMTTYKLGFEYTADENNTFRFGYSYGEQPVQSDDVLFNILAPGVEEQHVTFGWTRKQSNGGQLTLSLMYAPEKEVTGQSAFDPLQQIRLSMSQLEFEVSYRF
jgi:long-chain fatty acid transport protein